MWHEYKELGSHALQATLKRVDMAYHRFFKLKSGYPKFKTNRHYSGWTYPDKAGWKAESNGKQGYLNISNLGKIQMRGQARTWGTPTTLRGDKQLEAVMKWGLSQLRQKKIG